MAVILESTTYPGHDGRVAYPWRRGRHSASIARMRRRSGSEARRLMTVPCYRGTMADCAVIVTARSAFDYRTRVREARLVADTRDTGETAPGNVVCLRTAEPGAPPRLGHRGVLPIMRR